MLGRPADFDARIVQYLPGLRAFAQKNGFRGDERDDLVADTVVYCLANWTKYRPDGSFWSYLRWSMRGQISVRRDYARRRKRRGLIVDDPTGRIMESVSTPPEQEWRVDLGRTLRAAEKVGAEIVVRRAVTDDTLDVIAVERGVTRARVGQIVESRRKRLLKEMGAARD